MHFLQVDLRNGNIVDSIKSTPELEQCLSSGTPAKECKQQYNTPCKFGDLFTGKCVNNLENAEAKGIFNPYTLNLDSVGISVAIGLIFSSLSPTKMRSVRVMRTFSGTGTVTIPRGRPLLSTSRSAACTKATSSSVSCSSHASL